MVKFDFVSDGIERGKVFVFMIFGGFFFSFYSKFESIFIVFVEILAVEIC